MALRGAQLIASPASWPDSDSPDTRPPEVSKAMAGAAINRVDHRGYRVAGPEFGATTVLVADVDLDATLDKRLSTRNHVFADRRTDLC